MFQTTCYHSTQKRNSFWNTLHSTEPAPPELSTRESKALQRVHQWLEGHLQQRRSNCPREEAARFSRQPHACPWPGCPHTDMTHTHPWTHLLRHTHRHTHGHAHVHCRPQTYPDMLTRAHSCSLDSLRHTHTLSDMLSYTHSGTLTC